MNILITGKGGNAGSWKIRGQQLGAALGAAVRPMASEADCRKADVIVAVKRTPLNVIEKIRRNGKPWVWDIVDAWPQPCNWRCLQSFEWLKNTLAAYQPSGAVFGTLEMKTSAWLGHPGPLFSGASLVLPHHSWQKYVDDPVEVRKGVRVVGYEGSPSYLGKWKPVIERECARRGWRFVVNGDMRNADIGIALRDGGGYPARYWKPGTKLSNLHALGIPALCSREAGYESVANGTERWIESAADISAAFDALSPPAVRRHIYNRGRESMITVERVAALYRDWLNQFL